MANLPKLMEDIIQTSINTGPRGALRLAQGIQAVIGVGSEWLVDLSKVTALQFFLWYFIVNSTLFYEVKLLLFHLFVGFSTLSYICRKER